MDGGSNADRAEKIVTKGPPWEGVAHFKSVECLKRVGAKWNPKTKTWKATSYDMLAALVETGCWLPVGCDPETSILIPYVIRRQKMREEARQKRERESAQLEKEWHAKERELVAKRRQYEIPPNESEIVALLAEKGVTEQTIEASYEWECLGPKSGLSLASRLKRGVDLKILTWDEVVRGTVLRLVSNTGKKRGRGAQGVKREKKPVRKEKVTFLDDEEEEEGRTAAAAASRPHYSSNHSPKSKVTPQQPVKYVYQATCNTCSRRLDSRHQFGLECACGPWGRCIRCFVPMQGVLKGDVHCAGCAVVMVSSKAKKE